MKISGISGPVVLLLLAASAQVATSRPALADSEHVYEIVANDGYGLEDCLATGAECGRVVADAWCEAHGHGHATAFGLKSVVEARATSVSTANEPYVVTCGD